MARTTVLHTRSHERFSKHSTQRILPERRLAAEPDRSDRYEAQRVNRWDSLPVVRLGAYSLFWRVLVLAIASIYVACDFDDHPIDSRPAGKVATDAEEDCIAVQWDCDLTENAADYSVFYKQFRFRIEGDEPVEITEYLTSNSKQVYDSDLESSDRHLAFFAQADGKCEFRSTAIDDDSKWVRIFAGEVEWRYRGDAVHSQYSLLDTDEAWYKIASIGADTSMTYIDFHSVHNRLNRPPSLPSAQYYYTLNHDQNAFAFCTETQSPPQLNQAPQYVNQPGPQIAQQPEVQQPEVQQPAPVVCRRGEIRRGTNCYPDYGYYAGPNNEASTRICHTQYDEFPGQIDNCDQYVRESTTHTSCRDGAFCSPQNVIKASRFNYFFKVRGNNSPWPMTEADGANACAGAGGTYNPRTAVLKYDGEGNPDGVHPTDEATTPTCNCPGSDPLESWNFSQYLVVTCND